MASRGAQAVVPWGGCPMGPGLQRAFPKAALNMLRGPSWSNHGMFWWLLTFLVAFMAKSLNFNHLRRVHCWELRSRFGSCSLL